MSSVDVSTDKFDQAWRDPRLANIVYHDWQASTFNPKWVISYDDKIVDLARQRFARAAGQQGWPHQRSLEVGCGTGFFSLNLHRAGVLEDLWLTDISPGMVEVAARNARGLGVRADTKVAAAEELPFEDEQFDLVLGHDVLHHIPDVEKAIHESLRVLKPGGRFVFCGEPTRANEVLLPRFDQIAHWTSARAARIPKVGSELLNISAGVDPRPRAAELEVVVHIRALSPADLRRVARRAGGVDVATNTEDFSAAWFGASATSMGFAIRSPRVRRVWSGFNQRSQQLLRSADRALWARLLPEGAFATVSLTGTKQGWSSS